MMNHICYYEEICQHIWLIYINYKYTSVDKIKKTSFILRFDTR